ncbi:MAG: hypothetical protein EOP47_26335 [Sphingobacteriaceae bacterium]|nr:MAG: hypothetical protein EOP47_26335 [Sphingobacteriaceae bacterium]
MQFSLKRIWLLTGKQWTENRNLYLFGLLALIGVILCVSVFTLSTPYGFNHENQQVTFFIGMLLSGGIFTTRILSQFTERSKAIAALTLPASTLEKLTVAILY